MRKYRVYLSRTDHFSIDVEAPDEQAAMEIGCAAICDMDDPMQNLESCDGFEADDAEEIINDD